MSKRFNAVWGSDYYEPGERQVGIEFFAEDIGYNSEDKSAIDALVNGEEWRASDGSNHTVTRVS